MIGQNERQRRVIVYHAGYGCESGCCGHIVQLTTGETKFDFGHPYGGDHIEYAKRLVKELFGEEHVADLDWERCEIRED